MRLACSAYWLSLVQRLLLHVLLQMSSSLVLTPILPRKPPDENHHHEDAEPQDRQKLHHRILPIRPPKHREGETSPPHPPSSTPRTTPPLYAHTAFICTATFGAFGYVTLRYCTLNNFRGSVQTSSTVKPALAASCANSSSVYLYELSVQMLSPSLKEISPSPMRTVWFFRLTRCISMRL